MSTPIVVDTNILLKDVSVLEKDNVYIPYVVLQELDKLKRGGSVEFEARRAIRAIIASKALILTGFVNESVENNDDIILSYAKTNKATLYTDDACLTLKARAIGIEVEQSKDKDEIYNGYKTVTLTEEDMAYMYEHPEENMFDLYANQYLLVKDSSERVVDRLKWTDKLVALRLPSPKIIKPLNDLQAFAIDLLNDKDIPIKIIAGTYGGGKTICTLRLGLYHVLQKGNYSKLLIVRNPIGSGEEIGFIKGSKDEKIEPFYKAIEQNLDGGEIELQRMLQYRQLEFEIPFYLKGQSISNSFIIVEEAGDFDTKLIKLVGTRVAEGSCICFSGDWKQAEAKYSRDNGLVHLLNKTKDNPLVGAIILEEDVRSSASRVFAEL